MTAAILIVMEDISLYQNPGPSISWNVVKRWACAKAKVPVSDFEHLKAQFLFDIETVIEIEEIPGELV